jgi:hypothetical protein
MTTITHPFTLQLQSVVDESNSTIQKLLALPEQDRVLFLNQMAQDLILPEVEKALVKLNEGSGGWARLEVVA